MSVKPPQDHSSPEAPPAPGADLSIRELAHELNSLLDGSMRCVALAVRGLLDEADASATSAIERLQAAEHAMLDMSRLLEHAMGATSEEIAEITLDAMAHRLLDQYAAMAVERSVNVVLDIDPSIADLPAGILAPIVRNGLRNAIEAASRGHTTKQVEVLGSLDRKGRLVLIISDTGPGLPKGGESSGADAHGHGIGLWLSERLVHELGGHLSLTNVPFGSGAVWRLCIPPARLGTG